MPEDVVFLAIWKDEEKTVVIEYIPRREGRIEIVSIDIQYRPVSAWEQREAERQKPEP